MKKNMKLMISVLVIVATLFGTMGVAFARDWGYMNRTLSGNTTKQYTTDRHRDASSTTAVVSTRHYDDYYVSPSSASVAWQSLYMPSSGAKLTFSSTPSVGDDEYDLTSYSWYKYYTGSSYDYNLKLYNYSSYSRTIKGKWAP